MNEYLHTLIKSKNGIIIDNYVEWSSNETMINEVLALFEECYPNIFEEFDNSEDLNKIRENPQDFVALIETFNALNEASKSKKKASHQGIRFNYFRTRNLKKIKLFNGLDLVFDIKQWVHLIDSINLYNTYVEKKDLPIAFMKVLFEEEDETCHINNDDTDYRIVIVPDTKANNSLECVPIEEMTQFFKFESLYLNINIELRGNITFTIEFHNNLEMKKSFSLLKLKRLIEEK